MSERGYYTGPQPLIESPWCQMCFRCRIFQIKTKINIMHTLSIIYQPQQGPRQHPTIKHVSTSVVKHRINHTKWDHD